MSRNPKNQSAHDNLVLDLANKLEADGWEVQADLPNFDQPEPIGQDERIPDILATQDDATKIIEVETESTVNSHEEQHSTFRRSAAQRDNAEFELVVADTKKSKS